MDKVMFSSKTDQWATPQHIFDMLNNEFDFTLDPCADENNHKCDKYFTKNENGLLQDWGGTEFSVTLRTVKKFINGLKNAISRGIRKTH